jgi:hypothetical protein
LLEGEVIRSVDLCLCKTPEQDRLAALLLLVQARRGADRRRTRPDRPTRGTIFTHNACKGSRYATMWELDE